MQPAFFSTFLHIAGINSQIARSLNLSVISFASNLFAVYTLDAMFES